MKPPTKGLRAALLPCFSALAMAAMTAGAQAQLSSAQQSALKASCRSDFMSHCSGVRPGGQDALVCLQRNVARLSPACRTAVSATLPPPAAVKPARAARPPAASPTAAQQSALKASCRSDFMSHCSGVAPGGKAALACLQRNATRLSPACRKAVRATLPPPAIRPARGAPPPPAAGPTAAQQNALKASCRSDFMSHCSGVRPGGQEALFCLQQNAARLSPACQRAVIAIHPAARPIPPATPVVAAPPPPAKRPSLVSAAVMLRACKLDLLRHCHGVHPGGGRELACLAAHGDNLTIRCRTALKVTAPIR